MHFSLSNLDAQPHEQAGISFSDYQKSILQWTILCSGISTIAWQLFQKNQVLLFSLVLLTIFTGWLLTKNILAAFCVFLAGVFTVVMLIAGYMSIPSVSLVFCIIPLLAVILYGGIAGALSTIFVIVAMWWVSRYQPSFGYDPYRIAVTIGSLVLFSLGAIIRFFLVELIWRYFENYQRVSLELEKARAQRLELMQVQEDLMLANSELGRMTKQLKVLNQVAEEARSAKETFVTMVSHELRTPLNMIIGFSEVIAQSPQVYSRRLPPALLADINSIRRNSQHLLELVNDVLDLSQVDMGNMSVSRKRCSMEDIIAEAFDVISPLFVSKGLYLHANLQKDLGEIECDQTRIREVIINLLSNAGRFTETGGVEVRINREGSQLIVAVQDTGPGIAKNDQQKLFEPFQQLDDTIRRKHGGSGLGLAISKRFVVMHGGNMWLESTVGVGTTFFFSLPASSLPASLPTNTTEGQPAAGSVVRWVNPSTVKDPRSRSFKAPLSAPKPRCVVMEEGTTMQRLLQRYMSSIEVLSVPGIEEAVNSLAEHPSQLLIINHPEADELLRTISSKDRLPFGLPILAFWLPGGKDFSDSMDTHHYLVKPVSNEELLRSINDMGGDGIKQILLVDDNLEILQLYGRILSSASQKYQVLRATGGEQALDLLRRRHPDLMILDLIMPEMNGFQVLEEKQKHEDIRDIPVIVITAQDPTGLPKISHSITIAREGGFSPRDLLDVIERIGPNLDPAQG